MTTKSEVLTKPQQEFLLQRIQSATRSQYSDRNVRELEKTKAVIAAEKEIERLSLFVQSWKDKHSDHVRNVRKVLSREKDKAKQAVLFAQSAEYAIEIVNKFEKWCDGNLE